MIEDEVVFDTLTVRMFDRDPSGDRRETGVATAAIRVSRTGVSITPPNVNLTPGDSQQFEVITTQAPDTVLSYQWETSANGFGTLSATNQPTVLYTVKDDVEPPQTDSVKVTVFVGEGAARTKLGESTATISIVNPGGNKVAVLSSLTETGRWESFGYPGVGTFELRSLLFDPESGQLGPASGAPLYFPSDQVSRLTFRPNSNQGYVYRLSDIRYPGSEGERTDAFQVDPASGALSQGPSFQLEFPGVSVGSNGLYFKTRYGTDITPVSHFSLDTNGVPAPSGFVVPNGQLAPETLLIRDQQGADSVLYALRQGLLRGHRVDPANQTSIEVGGSPFVVFPESVGGLETLRYAPHPNKRFLLVAESQLEPDFTRLPRKLHSVEVDPLNGDILGSKDVFDFPNLDEFGNLAVTPENLVFVNYDDLIWVFRISSEGELTEIRQHAGISPTGTTQNLTLDSTGQYLFVRSMDAQKQIRTYRITQETGDLTLTDTDIFDGFPQRLAVMPAPDGGP